MNRINPNVKIDERTLKQLKRNVEEPAVTIVHCSYICSKEYENGGWVNIWPTTYLKHERTGILLPLLHAVGIPVGPDLHRFTNPGETIRFILIFPGVPNTWKRFSFLENIGGNTRFMVHDLKKEPGNIYHIMLSGDDCGNSA